jgi:hypothetical protein
MEQQPIRRLGGPADTEHEPNHRHSASVCSNTSRVSYVLQARHQPVAPCINQTASTTTDSKSLWTQ